MLIYFATALHKGRISSIFIFCIVILEGGFEDQFLPPEQFKEAEQFTVWSDLSSCKEKSGGLSVPCRTAFGITPSMTALGNIILLKHKKSNGYSQSASLLAHKPI